MPVAERLLLPLDTSGLAPLGPDFDEAVKAGLAELGIAAPASIRLALEAHARLLLAWNSAINLSALRTPAEVAVRHVLDSLTAVGAIRAHAARVGLDVSRGRLLDLGSGPGYPGLPLAVALPVGHATLLDSVAKKARFLAAAAETVGALLRAAAVTDGAPMPVVEARCDRAETLAASAATRESFDVVTVRAVGSLAEVAELGLPLLRRGGLLVAWKRAGTALDKEIAAAGVVAALGGSAPDALEVALPALPGHVLVLVRKIASSPLRVLRR